RSKTRSHGERIAGQGTRLINRTRWRHAIHDFRPAAIRADWQTASDDFAHRCEVGLNPISLLRAATGETKAGHDFVKNQNGSRVFCHVAQEFQKAGARWNTSHITDNGFDDDA